MHLAELRRRSIFSAMAAGRFASLLESRGVGSGRPAARRPAAGRASRALAAHRRGGSWQLSRRRRDRFPWQAAGQMAVVDRPRTHAWFGHARYPLEKLLAAGAIVALGTDSRASSPDLSSWPRCGTSPASFPPSAARRSWNWHAGRRGPWVSTPRSARGTRQVGQSGRRRLAGRRRGRSPRIALGRPGPWLQPGCGEMAVREQRWLVYPNDAKRRRAGAVGLRVYREEPRMSSRYVNRSLGGLLG